MILIYETIEAQRQQEQNYKDRAARKQAFQAAFI